MRRLALFCAALAAPSAAIAGSTVGEVVAQTIYETAKRNGEIMTDSKMSATVSAANAGVSSLRSAGGGDNWLAVAKGALFPDGHSLTTGGSPSNDGRFTGTGLGAVTDTTQVDCSRFTLTLDAQGNLIVPSIRLTGGAPMPANQWIARMSPGWPDGNSIARYAVQGQSLALWYAHKANLGNIDKRYWLGVWRINSNGSYDMSSQAYYDTQGNLVPRRANADEVRPSEHYAYIGAFGEISQPCPAQSSGGTTHYYLQNSNICTAYSPNASIGVGGYAYPETATVPAGSWNQSTWTSTDSLMACDANAEFLRRLADAAYLKATQQGGYSGYQYHPVTTADVRSGGAQPKVKDLAAAATVPTTFSGAGSTPAPVATDPAPTPTSSGGSSSGGSSIDLTHPEANAPDVNSPPEFKFWPDNLSSLIPSVDMSNYTGGTCPTYSGSVFGHQVALDAHCPLIENNRAFISTLMLFFWGILAALIVLRA